MTDTLLERSGLRNPRSGNGAREALTKALVGELGCPEYEATADRILAALWMAGFKIVPLEANDG